MNNYYPERYREDLRRLSRNFLRDFGGNVDNSVSFNGHLERKHFIGIPIYQRDLLVFSLMLEVLIDEVIYTHFRSDYDKFIESLGIPLPKFDFCGHGRLNRNPFSVLYLLENSRINRNRPQEINKEYFRAICREVILNFRRSLRDKDYFELNMENFQKALESDLDVMDQDLGKIFVNELKSAILSVNRIIELMNLRRRNIERRRIER